MLAFLVALVIGVIFIQLVIYVEIQRMNTNFQSLSEAITGLQSDVQSENTVIDGAVTLIEGIPALIQQAVQDALAKGATADQLTALSTLADSITAKSQALASAVATAPGGTTPAPNPGPPTP